MSTEEKNDQVQRARSQATSEGIAFVDELMDPEEPGRWSARFTVRLEHGETWQQGPDEVPLEQALDWARKHASAVSVLLGGTEVPYSAGRRQLPGAQYPVWPAEGMRVVPRPVGAPTGGTETATWTVRARIVIERLDPPLERLFLEQLRNDGRLDGIHTGLGESGLDLTARIDARGLASATAVATRAIDLVLERVLEGNARGYVLRAVEVWAERPKGISPFEPSEDLAG